MNDSININYINNINNFTRVRANHAPAPLNSDSHEVPVIYRTRSIQDTTVSSTTPRPNTNLYSQSDTGRGLNALQPGQIVPESPPRSPSRPNRPISRVTEDPRSTAMKKLRKEVYNPTSKLLAERLSLCYRDNTANVLMKERERNKLCAFCLEEFEGGQEVMITPCNHLFHEDCIMPRVTGNGHCPVCRFKICEKAENPSSFNNNIANLSPRDQISGPFGNYKCHGRSFSVGQWNSLI